MMHIVYKRTPHLTLDGLSEEEYESSIQETVNEKNVFEEI